MLLQQGSLIINRNRQYYYTQYVQQGRKFLTLSLIQEATMNEQLQV